MKVQTHEISRYEQPSICPVTNDGLEVETGLKIKIFLELAYHLPCLVKKKLSKLNGLIYICMYLFRNTNKLTIYQLFKTSFNLLCMHSYLYSYNYITYKQTILSYLFY